MKKTLIFAIAVISMSIVSCKKEHTCECTSTDTTVTTFSNGMTSTSYGSDSYKNTAEKQTKKYFRIDQACYNTTTTENSSGSGYTKVKTTTSNCTLK